MESRLSTIQQRINGNGEPASQWKSLVKLTVLFLQVIEPGLTLPAKLARIDLRPDHGCLIL